MDIKIDITGLPKGYLWQIDQERQRRIKNEKPDINPEPHRSGDGERREPQSHPKRKDSQPPKNTMQPKRPMMGIYKVIYKDKPPDEIDPHEWP